MRVAIIPARGGSKRLPRKNIAEIGGCPILSYPVTCAQNSGLFDKVLVSTEDDEIAAIARGLGAEVIARPPEIAQDSSTVVQVCIHALDEVEQKFGVAEVFCCIYATAAFITPEDLTTSLALLDSEPNADVVMGVSNYDIHPVQSLKKEGDYWSFMWPEYQDLQSKSYPHLVASNGTIYWTRTIIFRAQKTFYVDRLKVYELPRTRAVDIDTLEDLEVARQLMRAKDTGRKRDG